MEGKVIKEEILDKDSNPVSVTYAGSGGENSRRGKGSGGGKERCRSPGSPGLGGSPDGSPSSGGAVRTSPHHNGSAGSSSPGVAGSGVDNGVGGRPPPARLKRFLSTLVQFAAEMSGDAGERVRSLVHSLVSSTISVEEFQQALQEATNFPLRPFVLPFLRAALPPLQREVQTLARSAKQPPLQYVRSHEAVALEPGAADPADMFLGAPASPTPSKRGPSDLYYDGPTPQTNGVSHHPSGISGDPSDYQPQPKRAHPSAPGLLINPSPLMTFPLQSAHAHLFEYPHPYHLNYHSQASLETPSFQDPRRDPQLARDGAAGSAGAGLLLNSGPQGSKSDEEWKNINTMLNCILSMVEKTKRALAILQQRGNGQEAYSPEGADMKRAAGEIMAATVRQTEERVAELRRRAEESVNQVKRQAVAELQRAAAAERARLERLLRMPPSRRATSQSPPPPDHHNSCWNCGRKAQETCSGCNVARYCGAFCQHKDWENHHQVCCGRDQKPPSSSLLTVTSPPTQQPKPSQLTRSSTPVTSSTSNDRITLTADRLTLATDRLTENRLSLSSLNNAERLLTSTTQERLGLGVSGGQNSDRITLAGLGGGQGLVSGVGGKK